MRSLKRVRLWVLVLLLLGVSVTAVYAAFVTINTNDNAVDGAWGSTTPSPYYTDASGDVAGGGGSNMDITQAFVGTNGSLGTDYLYFRLDTVSGPSAPVGTGVGTTQRLFALIDCNNNGSFIDNNGAGGPTDLYVVYRPGAGADIVEIRNSAGVALLTSAAGTVNGEQPSGTNNVNEWRVQKQELTSRGCTNAVSNGLQFAFQTYTAGALNDETDGAPGAINGWNSPTSIHLQDFSAASRETIGAVQFTTLAMLVVVLGGVLMFYRRSRLD